MLASTLFATLAVLGTSMAAPVTEPGTSANPALVARAPGEKPKNWPIDHFITLTDNGKLLGIVDEKAAGSVLEKCVVTDWGKEYSNDQGKYRNGYVVCWQKTKHIAWDIRRMGDVNNCDTESKTETWELSEGQRESWEVSASISAAFEAFGFSMSASTSSEHTKNSAYTKSVACNPDFKDKRCLVGGQAILEVETVEGWVKLPPSDVDKKNKNKLYSNWQDVDTQNEPYGMYDSFTKNTYRSVDYGGYESGWNTWEGIGQEQCMTIFDNRFYAATLLK